MSCANIANSYVLHEITANTNTDYTLQNLCTNVDLRYFICWSTCRRWSAWQADNVLKQSSLGNLLVCFHQFIIYILFKLSIVQVGGVVLERHAIAPHQELIEIPV